MLTMERRLVAVPHPTRELQQLGQPGEPLGGRGQEQTHALGFVANWITEWYAYHPLVQEKLGLKPGERVAGFIYIGTSSVPLEERPRPEMERVVSYF